MGRGLFPIVSQYLQQQYPAEGQASNNNEFINNPSHQLPRTSISISIRVQQKQNNCPVQAEWKNK